MLNGWSNHPEINGKVLKRHWDMHMHAYTTALKIRDQPRRLQKLKTSSNSTEQVVGTSQVPVPELLVKSAADPKLHTDGHVVLLQLSDETITDQSTDAIHNIERGDSNPNSIGSFCLLFQFFMMNCQLTKINQLNIRSE